MLLFVPLGNAYKSTCMTNIMHFLVCKTGAFMGYLMSINDAITGGGRRSKRKQMMPCWVHTILPTTPYHPDLIWLLIYKEHSKNHVVDFAFTDNFWLWNGQYCDIIVISKKIFWLFSILSKLYKVNRCLARYSPRATTTNRASNEPARPGKNANLGPNLVVLGQKSDFCHTILVNNPFVALGVTVNFPPWDRFFDFPLQQFS